MNMRISWVCCAVFFLATPAARADVAPIDFCTAPGQPCGADAACSCKDTTCMKQIPCSSCGGSLHCDGGAGGTGGHADLDDGGSARDYCIATYACNRCVHEDMTSCPNDGSSGKGGRGGVGGGGSGGVGTGGKGGAGGAGGTGGAPSKDAGPAENDEDSGCACSLSGRPSTSSFLLWVGLLIWLTCRTQLRRRRP